MKFFAVFSAIVAVALASPATWTVNELSEAIQNPNTHVSLIPILEGALNELMSQVVAGSPQTEITVSTAVQDFSSWTLNELSEAIQDPATNPALLPYLEHALNTMVANLFAGEQQEYIIVGTPVGLLPIDQAVVPVVPAPIVTPVVPAPVESAVTPVASPLVQIIVNIKSQQEEPAVPIPDVSPLPMPIPIDESIIPVIPRPQPVPAPIVMPSPVVLPAPVAPEVIAPEPVIVAPVIVPNPVDVIAVNPEGISVNPIDVVAVAAPEVNPIDILSPVPVVSPVGAVDVVGPLV